MNKNYQIVGYKRVSSADQNPARQLEGEVLDKTFTDYASGKDADRPQLALMLAHVREHDVVVVHSMDRLARNSTDLRRIVEDLNNRKVVVRFRKEGFEFGADQSAMGMLMMNMMGAFAEFERAIIRERQREGIDLAKKRGVYKGRRKSLSADEISEVVSRVNAGEVKSRIALEYGISRETLYQYLRTDSRNLIDKNTGQTL